MGKGKYFQEKYAEKRKLRKKLCHFCLPRGQVVRLYSSPSMKYVDIRSSVYGRPAKYGLMLTLPEYLEMVQKLKVEVDKLIEEDFAEIEAGATQIATGEVLVEQKSENE